MKKKPSVCKGKYYLSVSIGDKNWSLETNDLGAALRSIKPEKITSKVTLQVSTKEKTIDKLMYVAFARRTFFNELATNIYARNLERALS